MAEQSRRFGERLAELRQAKGWKQKDLVSAMADAGDLALNTNQLSRYENGGAYPNESRMQRFAQVLGVDFADLVAPRPEPESVDLSDALSEAEPDSGTQDQLNRIEQKLDSLLEILEERFLAKAGAQSAQDAETEQSRGTRRAR